MNLQSIYLKCKNSISAFQNLKASNEKATGANGGTITVTKVEGWLDASASIVDLQGIKYLDDYLSSLMSAVPEYFRNDDSFSVKTSDGNNIAVARDHLVRAMTDAIDLYESMGIGIPTEEKSNTIGFNIKIPACNNLTDYQNYIKDINKVLTQCPYLNVKDEKIEFEGTDVGSLWLTFTVVMIAGAAGSVFLNNLAALIDKSIQIRSHWLTVEKQKEDLKKTEKDNQKREVILDYLTNSYKVYVDETLADLNESAEITNDEEAKSRAENSAEWLGKLIDKGVQIYLAVDSPTEAKALFKPLEMKYINGIEFQKISARDHEESDSPDKKE